MAYDDHVAQFYEEQGRAETQAEIVRAEKENWSKEALQHLISLRKSVHNSHLHMRAIGPLGSCYACGNGLNDFIRKGEELFK